MAANTNLFLLSIFSNLSHYVTVPVVKYLFTSAPCHNINLTCSVLICTPCTTLLKSNNRDLLILRLTWQTLCYMLPSMLKKVTIRYDTIDLSLEKIRFCFQKQNTSSLFSCWGNACEASEAWTLRSILEGWNFKIGSVIVVWSCNPTFSFKISLETHPSQSCSCDLTGSR